MRLNVSIEADTARFFALGWEPKRELKVLENADDCRDLFSIVRLIRRHTSANILPVQHLEKLPLPKGLGEI